MANNNQVDLNEVMSNAPVDSIPMCNGANLEARGLAQLASLLVPHLPDPSPVVYVPKTSATPDATLTLTGADVKVAVTGGYKEVQLPASGPLPHGHKIVIGNFSSGSNGASGALKVKSASGASIHFGGIEIDMDNLDVIELELVKIPQIQDQWVSNA